MLLPVSVYAAPGIGYDVVDLSISVETKYPSYEKGSTIDISGLITNYDDSDPTKVFDITIRIVDPKNNIIAVSQITPNSGGTYSTSLNTEGNMWKFAGDYTVMVNYADKNASTTFALTVTEIVEEAPVGAGAGAAADAGAEAPAPAEVEEVAAAEKCGEGTHLEDGVCVLDKVVSVETTPAPASSSTVVSSWVYSITFAVLIAFVVAIFLYLISRASRRKTS